jgi:3-phenylpropionate/trans-cinnamate dioxygenase ferredoxin subunit
VTETRAFAVVADVGEIPPGGMKPVTFAGRSLLLIRLEDRYFAVQRLCLHQGADLAGGIVCGAALVCAAHGWQFDVRTGRQIVPGAEANAADERVDAAEMNCLASYPVRIEAGRILVGYTSTTAQPR